MYFSKVHILYHDVTSYGPVFLIPMQEVEGSVYTFIEGSIYRSSIPPNPNNWKTVIKG